jgi:hypothetical protein
MILNANDFTVEETLEADICIIGAGPAGICLASELATNGRQVVLLDGGGNNYDQNSQELYASTSWPDDYPNPLYSRLRMLGGSSNHWANNTSTLDPIDFERRSWIPDSGWPFGYDEIKPFYARAGQYCGTGTDGYDLEYWLSTTGMIDQVAGSSFLVTDIAKASTPAIRFFQQSEEYLLNSKHIRVISKANLTMLDYDLESQAIKAVHFKPGIESKHVHKVVSKRFILCMGGLENARMLLHFNRKYNNGLGHSEGNVGRYFMDHPLPRAAIYYPTHSNNYNLYLGRQLEKRRIVGFLKLNQKQLIAHKSINLRMPLVPTSNYLLSDGISSFNTLSDAVSEGEWPNEFGLHLINILSDLDMVGEAISRKSFDYPIFDHANDIGGYQIPLTMEQIPDRNNRVFLSNENDRFGIPKLSIDWEIKPENKEMLWKSLELTARGLGAHGLGRLRLLKERGNRIWGSQLGFGNHHMGTTRMSGSEKKGVVDANQKVYGTKNLYVGGSSVFPTGGHVPPTLTIVALSIRLAKHLNSGSI